MTVESTFPLTPILQPYILIKIQIYIFSTKRNVSITSSENFISNIQYI
jgi:hypothetical protein